MSDSLVKKQVNSLFEPPSLFCGSVGTLFSKVPDTYLLVVAVFLALENAGTQILYQLLELKLLKPAS